MYSIGFIGPFSEYHSSSSGQIVRTTLFYEMLINRYGNNDVCAVSTLENKKHPLKLLIESIKCIFFSKKIVLMTHENGCKFYLPVLYLSKKYLGKKIYHNVIGGRFDEYLSENKKLIKYAKSFDLNWIQMQAQIEKLKKLGINNTCLLPNTKNNHILARDQVKDCNDPTFRFCTFSRISKEKGIELAIDSVKRINTYFGKDIASLDIYGEPDDDYVERFNEIKTVMPKYISYCGCVNSALSCKILQNYYMLLFPSTYRGEGFPGTIWDAFASGLPVIASDWHYNSEIVEDNVTGFIYHYEKPQELFEKILYAIKHKELIDSFKLNCINEAEKYSPSKVWPIVYDVLDN